MVTSLKKQSNIIRLFVINFIIFTFLLSAGYCFAGNLNDAFDIPLDEVAGPMGAGYNTDTNMEQLIGLIIQIALSFLGVIFLGLTIYGGYIWMIARGNEQEAKKAKDIITAAIIGLIIVIAAYAISILIISKLGSVALQGQ